MADKPDELAGTQRAAILLMSLGEQDAANLLKQLDAREVQKLGVAMAELKEVSREQMSSVLNQEKRDDKAAEGKKSSDEFFKQQLLFVLDSARHAGLTIHSYGSQKEKNAQWYKKELAHFDLSGSREQIMAFLEKVKNSEKMISVSRWSLVHVSGTSYALNCDMGFVFVA